MLAYGIRTDFQTVAFPGSRRLLEIAHSLEELKTICRCGRKAVFNARKVDGRFVFDGDQVAIDGAREVTYESLCGACYLDESGGVLNRGWRPQARLQLRHRARRRLHVAPRRKGHPMGGPASCRGNRI